MPEKQKTAVYALWPEILVMCAVAVFLCPDFAASAGQAKKLEKQMHGQAWAFGKSASRNDVLWHKGVNADAVSRRAVPKKNTFKSVDTSGGIARALDAAEKKKRSGNLGVSMGNQSSSWKVNPNAMRADEFKPRDKHHILRAYADMKAGDDLDIKIGPELILRDEYAAEERAHEKQPDSSLGVGMRFKYDF